MNNRQAGRRRGRGGQQRQGGGSSNQGNGNRIDNRARGNAAQLLEKYKNLARDAQMQGDRVNTEYYLQFADHYFRVLNESRARFEEQNQRRQRDEAEDEDFEFEGEAAEAQPEPRPRREREPREPREAREPREDRRNGHAAAQANGHAPAETGTDEGEAADDAAESAESKERAPRRRTARPRRDEAGADEGTAPGIDVAVLPPALGADTGTTAEGEEAPRKPRRRRTIKADDAEAQPAG